MFGQDQLCTICEKIKFEGLLKSTLEDSATYIKLGVLSYHRSMQTCPLCRFITELANAGLDGVQTLEEWDKITIASTSHRMLSAHYLRTANISPAYRLELVANVPITFVGSRNIPLGGLDICEESYRPPNANYSSAMLRIARPCRFDPGTLSGWLRVHCHGQPGLGERRRRNASNQLTKPEKSALDELIESGYFRLLDVGTNEVIQFSKDNRPRTLSYVALSYRSGDRDCASAIICPSRSHTQQGHLVAWEVNPNPKLLPKTIRDAAQLVDKLEMRYLWVDALCINQKDNDDKAAVIAQMQLIYASAYLTVVAANGKGADAGLRRFTECQSHSEKPRRIEQGGKSFCAFLALPDLEKVLERSEWNSRGWTYQERVLSRACVYFTDHEVFFTTHGVEEREGYRLVHMISESIERENPMRRTGKLTSVHDIISDERAWKNRRFTKYKKAVEDYSRRFLCDPRDRLDAFSGILEALMEKAPRDHDVSALSGLAYFHAKHERLEYCHPFGSSLLWDSDEPVREKDRIELNATEKRKLPSWSWAGWSCRVEFADVKPAMFIPERLDDNNIRCVDDDQFGRGPWPDKEMAKVRPVPAGSAFALHFCLPIIELKLARNRHYGRSKGLDTNRKFHVLLPATDQIVGSITVAEEFIRQDDIDRVYKFLCLGHRNMWFIRARGSCYERIALGFWNIAGEAMILPKAKYVVII